MAIYLKVFDFHTELSSVLDLSYSSHDPLGSCNAMHSISCFHSTCPLPTKVMGLCAMRNTENGDLNEA